MRIPQRRHRATGADQDDVLAAATGSPALQRLLSEASAPAHADELAGLGAALTAFAQSPTPARRHPVSSLVAKLLAAKAVAATVGSVAVGGVALAAATTSLPTPLQNTAHDVFHAPAPHAAHSPKPADQLDAATEASESAEPTSTPSPGMVGLCRAFPHASDAQGKATANPAFTVLITTAGGLDKVNAYCATVLAGAPGGKPTTSPGQGADHRPSPFPGGKPATHPTGSSNH